MMSFLVLRRLRIGLAVVLLVMCQSALANRINGVASYQALNVEQFIAMLYTSTPTASAADLLENDTAARMEIRVTRRYISQRRFMTMWLESITVNNRSEAVQKQMESLSAFNQMFKGRLLAGDRVVFEYTPSTGMEVTLNGVRLGNIPEGDFFRMLLACWIGDVPLSSDLKMALLAPENVDQEVLGRFNVITPNAERRDAIVAWWKPNSSSTGATASAPVAAKPTPKPKIEPKVEPKIAPTVAPTPAVAKTVEKTAPVVKAAVEKVASADVKEEVKTKAPKPAAAKSTEASLKETNLNEAKLTEAKPEKAVAPVQVESQPEATESDNPAEKSSQPKGGKSILAQLNPQGATGFDDEDEENETMGALDVGGLMVRQQYYEALSKHLIQYQKTPRQAYQRKLEDEVRVYITIDRRGTVMSVELERESKYKMFNKQALEAVEKAQPFPEIPAEISGDTFSFSVLLAYRLPI